MQAKAQVKNVRIAPRKMRLIVDMVRGKSVQQALEELKFASKRGVIVIEKLIKSAAANAVNNHNMSDKGLFIKEIFVDEGMPLKRIMPRARGKADRFMKKSSHATVIVAEA
ncbi:MAG: 50S ribosomal protein L22 [Candidatus Cloacimonetes bacterium]|nr:50S ribosomal protein L22 [Candidatus Cloacimonadota bacterium]